MIVIDRNPIKRKTFSLETKGRKKILRVKN